MRHQQQQKPDTCQDYEERDHVRQPGGRQEEPEKPLVISESPVKRLKRTKALVDPQEETLQDQEGYSRQNQRARFPGNAEIIYDPQTYHEENGKGGMDDPNKEEHIHNP